MKNQSAIFLIILIALFGSIFSGCADDITLPPEGSGAETYDGIVIRIPDPRGLASTLTRSESNAEQLDLVGKEGLITSLHVYTVKSNGTVKHADLLADNAVEEITLSGHRDDATKYRDFDITRLFYKDGGNAIDEGSYKIYVVANLESYLDNSGNMPEISSEDDIKNLPLYFFKQNDGEENPEYLLTRSHVETYGLPMACLPDEIQYSGNGSNLVSNGTVSITSSSRGTIHADLAFLCSKVRYSIFFDKKNTPSAAEIFKDMSFDISEVDALNVIGNGTAVGSDRSATVSTPSRYDLGKLTFSERAFTNPDNYPIEGSENTPLDELKGDPDLDQRAWQGVLYLPENASQTSSTLSFAANAVKTANGVASGNVSELGFKIPLLPEVTDGSKAVKRGVAYDIVARVAKIDNLEILRLQPQIWTPLSLEYILTAPAYLHVDCTRLSLSGGEKKEIKYESNADIQFDIPKYNGVNVYTLKKNIETGTIEVSVNSAISTSDFSNIRAQEEKYNFFHIIAGNIRKKIEITPLDLHRFLTLSPSNITLDVREQMGSGNYSGDYDVVIETNVENFQIRDVDWGAAAPGGNVKMYIINKNDEAEELKFNEDYEPIEGVRRIRIHYENINSGDDFWKQNKSLNIKVAADNTGLNANNPDYISDTTVRFNVVKSTDSYTIHFHDGGEDWTNPHIYVYQCLEIPSYWNKEVESNGKTYYTGSMPVGYQDQTNGAHNTMAALEYIFTGAVAFLGWDTYSNAVSLNSLVIDSNKGWYEEGFWIFSDGWYNDDAVGCSWNPNFSVAESRYAIGPDVDFCKEYRQSVDCDACKQGTGNKTWPGIKMEKEVDGWWKFELSGMATPGKALIMFADGHSWYAGIRRWPSDLMVGIPLFDYPDKEGWYSMASCEFTNSKESAEEASSKRPYVEYDNSGSNWGEVYAHFYGYDDSNKDHIQVREWPGYKMTKDPNSNKWHCIIPRDWANNPRDKKINVIFNNNSGSQTGESNLGDVTIVTR